MRKISIFLIMLLALSSLVLGASIIQVRRDTAANWVSSNPILAQGEMGLETDTLKLKFGNGTGTWNALPYYSTDLFDPSGYYTSIQIDSQNLTMTEFVLYVNSTNDAGNDYNDAWINTTIDTKDIVVNTSMKNYVDNLNGTWEDSSSNLTEQNIADFGFLKFLNLTSYITNLNTSWVDTLIDNRVVQSFVQTLGFYTKDEVYNTTEIDTLGNWSADKIDYSTTVLIQGWIDGNYTALDGKIDSIENLTLAQIVTNIGNWSNDKGDYYTSSEVDSIITTMDNLSLLQIVTNIGNWSADKGDYSTTTSANLLYAPTGYGDEWNKTYADTLYLTSYQNLTDADILAFGYNHTVDLTAYFNTLYSNSTDTNETTRVDILVSQVDSMENLSTSDVQGIKVNNATYADDSALLGGELPSVYLDNTDYCSDGSCGSLVVTGNFTIIGNYINATVENQFINGSIIPELDDEFDLGSQSKRWDNIYTTNIVSDDWTNVTITENQISDLQDYLTSYQNLTDSDILAFGYNHTTDLTAYFNTLYSNSTDTNETTRVDTLVNQVASMENLSMVEVAANTTGYGYITSYDNLSGDNVVGMVGNWSAWDNITGIPHATPSNSDITHFSLADEIYDWVIGLGYSTTVGTVTSVTGTSPIVSSGGATPAISATILKDLVTTAPLTGAVDNVFVGTDSDITLAITMGGDLVTTAPLTGGVLNIFPGSGTKATIAMPVATTSADGYLDKDDWNTFNNKADSDTTYSAGNGISEALTVFSVAGGTALTQDAGGLSVTDGGIGDTQIADAYINQALTTTSNPTFNNQTITECIVFASGGKICSGS